MNNTFYPEQIKILKDRNAFFLNFESRMLCLDCKMIMLEANQTSCGCRFCEKCISNQVKCPSCLEYPISLYRDVSIIREIFNLEVKCFNSGCAKEMKFRDLSQHLIECEYKKETIKCPLYDFGCNLFCDETTIFEHLKKENHNVVLKSRFKELQDEYKTKIKKLERHIEKLNSKNSSNCNDFKWIIDNIRQKITNAKQGIVDYTISPAFYVSPRGYKMALKIFFHGNGVGKGKYLALYFIICKGEFDHELDWPFK